MQPLRNSALKALQPLARASMPSRVIWSHHDRFSSSSILQPSLNKDTKPRVKRTPLGAHSRSKGLLLSGGLELLLAGLLCDVRWIPEGLQRVVADGHAGGEIKLLEFGAKLAEADAGAVGDLGAAVQV